MPDGKARVITLIIQAATVTKQAIADSPPSDRPDLGVHFAQQMRELAAYVGYPARDIEDFMFGQNVTVARQVYRLTGDIAPLLTVGLGYDPKDITK